MKKYYLITTADLITFEGVYGVPAHMCCNDFSNVPASNDGNDKLISSTGAVIVRPEDNITLIEKTQEEAFNLVRSSEWTPNN